MDSRLSVICVIGGLSINSGYSWCYSYQAKSKPPLKACGHASATACLNNSRRNARKRSRRRLLLWNELPADVPTYTYTITHTSGTSDYTVKTMYSCYFKGISANVQLEVYSVMCC
jgi:hypothetical protein